MPRLVHEFEVENPVDGPTIGPAILKKNLYYGVAKDVPFDTDELNSLDIVARHILAYKFTIVHNEEAGNRVDPVLHSLRDRETVACVMVNDGHLLVAHNFKFRDADTNRIPFELATAKTVEAMKAEGLRIKTYAAVPFYIAKRKKDFHAEMQLLEYVSDNAMSIQGGVIGVSKPCCDDCARTLTSMGIDFSFRAGVAIGDWQPPKCTHVAKTTSLIL
ncbi:hypothetical protein RugamoR64_37690 [Duganella rhizosphaerae]|uniref:hypothetical protein n=1 Tax=Duganella rhizosphaerae TaxID=2885763 RepID=UPI0030EAE1D8